MKNKDINYSIIVDEAMRSIVKRTLKIIVQRDSKLPGNHHFYITADLAHPEIKVSSKLRDKYQDKITVVIQHQFSDLIVEDSFFEVTLNFNSIPEKLHIPFASVLSFADPSCSFGLQFDEIDEEYFDEEDDDFQLQIEENTEKSKGKEKNQDSKKDDKNSNSKVISLDSFRKK